jgi:hypothetical protein
LICCLVFSVWAVGSAAAQAADCPHAMLMKWASQHGFRKQTSDGNEQYCRNVIITGSRIPHYECGSEADLASYAYELDDYDPHWSCKQQ